MPTTKPATGTNQLNDVKKVPSQILLGEAGEIVIVHNGREYRLRVTQNGKLILTA